MSSSNFLKSFERKSLTKIKTSVQRNSRKFAKKVEEQCSSIVKKAKEKTKELRSDGKSSEASKSTSAPGYDIVRTVSVDAIDSSKASQGLSISADFQEGATLSYATAPTLPRTTDTAAYTGEGGASVTAKIPGSKLATETKSAKTRLQPPEWLRKTLRPRRKMRPF